MDWGRIRELAEIVVKFCDFITGNKKENKTEELKDVKGSEK